jgi:hypothetical protein
MASANVFIPAEVINLIIRNIVATSAGDDVRALAALRAVGRTWRTTVDASTTRLRPRDLFDKADLQIFLAWVCDKYPAVRCLDMGRSCGQCVVATQHADMQELLRLQGMLHALLVDWPHEVVLRAGVGACNICGVSHIVCPAWSICAAIQHDMQHIHCFQVGNISLECTSMV